MPLQVEQRDLSEDIAPIRPRSGPGGKPYEAARVLVRRHSRPLGTVDVPLPDGGLEPNELRHRLESAFRARLQHGADAGESLRDPPFASVVIPTRDRPQLLAPCLDAVLAVEYPEERFEVVVADNAPSDTSTRDAVERVTARDERVSYVVAPRPGSASARNDGARHARGSIVAFVDDDAVVDRHWLRELVAGFTLERVVCVTGLVIAAELDTWAQQLFEEYGGFGKGFDDAVYDIGDNRPDQPLFPFNPAILGSGNNVAFRRETLLEVGGYDPCLGNGTPTRSGEDWELFLRLFRLGFTASYRPAAIVHHRHRRELPELIAQIHDYGVGVGAGLARTIAHDPRAALEIAARMPAAARYLISSSSPKNRNRGDAYPRSLLRAEVLGMMRGPMAYLRSRRAAAG